jgi:hypothetical protein
MMVFEVTCNYSVVRYVMRNILRDEFRQVLEVVYLVFSFRPIRAANVPLFLLSVSRRFVKKTNWRLEIWLC